jgi:hypothetical protein
MTRAASATTAILADDFGADPTVILWTASARRRAAARVGNAGGAGAGPRPPRPGGEVVMWGKRFWPRRQQDAALAIAQTWRLHAHGVIDAVELAIRDAEYRAMQGWLQ